MTALMKRILAVSGKYRRRIIIAFIVSFFKSMFSKAPIMLAFYVLSRFYQKTADGNLCLITGLSIAVCVILQIILQHTADRLQSAAGFMIFSDMRIQLGAHLRRMPMGYFTEGNIGKISSVLSSDMIFIEENCMTVFADLMSYIFSQIIMIAFLLFMDPRIGIAALAVVVIAVIIAGGMKKDSMKHACVRQEQNEKMTEAVLDFTEGIAIAKTYNLSGEKSKELSESFDETCRTSIAFEKSQFIWMVSLYILYGAGAALLIWLSFILHGSGQMQAVMVIGVLLFAFSVFGPIKALHSQSTRLTVMNSCMDRIEEVFAQKELPDDGKNRIPEIKDVPEVEFRNVCFGYEEKEVLHDISFKVEKNNMMALVGPSGGGKTTIANLLARFWDINEGEVLIRGKNVKDVSLSDLMDHISMVFQRVYLFQDTVYNNIAMGRTDASEEEVIEAAKKARCYDFIMALPDGFNTVIGEGGESLSGGEKQRISIARCILKDAPIIILDEATASVDADNEKYIQDAISELCRGKTLLVIAHRLNTIQNADRILVISDGRIAETGNHDELIRNKGIYYDFIMKRRSTKGWNRRKTA